MLGCCSIQCTSLPRNVSSYSRKILHRVDSNSFVLKKSFDEKSFLLLQKFVNGTYLFYFYFFVQLIVSKFENLLTDRTLKA